MAAYKKCLHEDYERKWKEFYFPPQTPKVMSFISVPASGKIREREREETNFKLLIFAMKRVEQSFAWVQALKHCSVLFLIWRALIKKVLLLKKFIVSFQLRENVVCYPNRLAPCAFEANA